MAGRKPLPPDQRLSARVEIRMTEKQAAKLERLAAAGQQSGSDWLRDKIDRAREAKQASAPPPAAPAKLAWKAGTSRIAESAVQLRPLREP